MKLEALKTGAEAYLPLLIKAIYGITRSGSLTCRSPRRLAGCAFLIISSVSDVYKNFNPLKFAVVNRITSAVYERLFKFLHPY